jgi:hypothetical protein
MMFPRADGDSSGGLEVGTLPCGANDIDLRDRLTELKDIVLRNDGLRLDVKRGGELSACCW